MNKFTMTINGQQSQSTLYCDVINPATGQAFAQYQQGGVDDLNQAVASAKSAFNSWSQTSSAQRKAKMLALAGVLEANMPELMALITQETGKPMAGLNNVGSGMEVGGSIAWTQMTAELELA
ncbi:aldehyde dehydrogenase family protein, partial [Candidatus Colwellia aromaticivorans]|uniref:aldehyde dehydrogenase family protein n=1 Tax=Candidatus Colwellia aromaticivorans TaxID=2267621 RepID=UPI000DF2D742